MKHSKYSVVIIGGGIAGLYAALKITQQCQLSDGLLLITKSKIGESNSRYAQGGIVAVLEENKKDSTSLHVSDTLKAGAGLSDFNVTKFISENSDHVIKDLLNFGVEFDKNDNNDFFLTLEAAHSVNRILHSGGDATGRGIEKALTKKVIENKNVEVYEQTLAVELLTNSDGECKGLVAFNDLTKEYETIYSSAVILASGGLGQLYKYTTNPSVATGDGIALSYSAGAVIQDMEFIQFHPTALAIDSDENRFLISEAVRGEGAKLVDANGVEFMHKYNEKKELAPRDIVTRAIFNEMKEQNLNNVYLNATALGKDLLQRRFPNISRICEENGIDISKDYIPVSPAAHYSMGGIKTDIEGKTSIKGLYAIGEVASTGLHGANRLASNSLLECVVCAYELANYLTFANLVPPKHINDDMKKLIDEYSEDIEDDVEYDVDSLKSKLQNIMWNYVGILRDEKALETANEKLQELKAEFQTGKKCSNKWEYEFKNMLTTAQLIIDSALKRKESRGAHSRTDYTQTNEKAEHNCMVKGEKAWFSFIKEVGMFLNEFLIEDHIKSALQEDIGFGDITTDYLTEDKDSLSVALMTRNSGVLCGCQIFAKVFKILSSDVNIKFYFKDGDFITAGAKIATINGPARFILTGERTALNYIQRLSGIATETKKYQDAIGDYSAKIVDTRKTTPNFRIFEKYAVKTGGGALHRFNLSDCAMIKDNHIRFAGSITKAVEKIRKNLSHAHKIEVECDTLEQVKEALNCGVDIIMLDNMSISDMKKACELINKTAIVEASGNITLSTVKEIASTGVDIISSSAIVAKAPTLDLALDI